MIAYLDFEPETQPGVDIRLPYKPRACEHAEELKGTEHRGMREVVCVQCGHEWRRFRLTWRTLADEAKAAKKAEAFDRKAATDGE